MYIWCICIYIYIIYIYITIHIYMISHHHIHLLSIFSHHPSPGARLWGLSAEGSHETADPTALRGPTNGSLGPQKAGPKSTRNGRKPMETMDLQHGHGNIMVFLPWFFHRWKMNIGRCKFRTVTCKSSNPITKAKTHIMKNTHIYIYIHRCIYIYIKKCIYIYIYISVPNISISISGKTSTFFSWQRRPPTWTTSWRSCWIHGFRRRRACWMIGTLKNGEETMGLYHG